MRTTVTHDVALTLLGLPEGENQTATIRVTIQPLVVWLWIGGGIMAFGTLLAVFPGRRRNPIDPVSAPVGGGRRVGGSGPAAPERGAIVPGPGPVPTPEPSDAPVSAAVPRPRGVGVRPATIRPVSGPEGQR